jgi:hypothetical protein
MGCLYTRLKTVVQDTKLEPEPELELKPDPIPDSDSDSSIELPFYPSSTIVIIEKKPYRSVSHVEQYKMSVGLLPRITI